MIISKEKKKNRVSYFLLRVVWTLFEFDKKSRYYGTDKQLHEAEIHMIKYIKENEGIHVTGLADLLGVTKGAVSQIVKKIKDKEMITKETSSDNLSKIILKLTEKGETAYNNHELLHKKFDAMVEDALRGYSVDEIEKLKLFLNTLENKIEEYEE